MTKTRVRGSPPERRLPDDLSIIRGPFVVAMRQAGYPAATTRLYQLSLERVAVWLSRRRRSLCSVSGEDVPIILREFFLRRLRCRTKTRHRAALHAWLAFRGLPRGLPDESRHARWRPMARPSGISDQLFLRIHPPVSQPTTPGIVRCAARRAYSRCGFPSAWTGTHRLRHTFATRLYARGATLAEISSLLGHRCLESSTRYTHTDLTSLRTLAQSWPTRTRSPVPR
jgi:site-specific recombinase XerD